MAPTPSPTDLLLKVPGVSKSLDFNQLIQSAPAWGQWWNSHAGLGLIPLGAGVGTWWVVKHHHHMPKMHGSAWKHPLRAWVHARRFAKKTAKAKMTHVPRVLGVNAFPAGHTYTVAHVDGRTTESLTDIADNLASAFAARKVIVEPHEDRADRAFVHVIRRDPFAKAVITPLMGVERTNWLKPFVVGVDVFGRPAKIDLVGGDGVNHILIGGATGSGKSNVIQLLMAHAALDPRTLIYGFDGKFGMELGFWAERIELLNENPRDMGTAITQLSQVAKIVDARNQKLKDAGKRKPTADMAPMVLVIEELASWLVDCGKESGNAFARVLMGMIRVARSAGCVIVGTTQRPSVDVVPSSLRSQFTYRWALRTMAPVDSDIILGPNWARQGFDSSTVGDKGKGQGYLLHEERNPELIRAHLVPDAELKALVARSVDLHRANAPGKRRANASANAPRPEALARANEQVTGSKGTRPDGDGVDREEGIERKEETGGEPRGGLGERDLLVLRALVDHTLTLEDIQALTDPPMARSRARALVERLARRNLLAERVKREPDKGAASPDLYTANLKGREYAKSVTVSAGKGDVA